MSVFTVNDSKDEGYRSTQTISGSRTVEELRNIGLTVLGGITLLGTAPRRRTAVATLGFVAGVLLLGAIYGALMARVLRASALV